MCAYTPPIGPQFIRLKGAIADDTPSLLLHASQPASQPASVCARTHARTFLCLPLRLFARQSVGVFPPSRTHARTHLLHFGGLHVLLHVGLELRVVHQGLHLPHDLRVVLHGHDLLQRRGVLDCK